MSNIFDSLRVYGGKWSVKSTRAFTDDECNSIKKAQVVDSEYGLSACFMMSNGYSSYIPMSSDAAVSVGDVLDMKKASLITLEKAGEADIMRVGY